jgi:putative restriction endonuclease
MNPFISPLTSLTTAKIAGRQAPHKAVLLLAVMDLVEAGVITSPRVVLTEKLEEAFDRVWRRYVSASIIFTPKVATPFWHMQNEPFWRLCLNNGQDLAGMKARYSVHWLRENTYALLDPELFSLMRDESARAQMRVLLISTYLQDLHADTDAALSLLALLGMLINLAA